MRVLGGRVTRILGNLPAAEAFPTFLDLDGPRVPAAVPSRDFLIPSIAVGRFTFFRCGNYRTEVLGTSSDLVYDESSHECC